jgi:hypothetical protein
VTRHYLIDEVPVFARAGTIIPGQRTVERLAPGSYRDLVLTVMPGGTGGAYELYEDDGLTDGYQRGASATIPLAHKVTKSGRVVTVGPARGSFKGFLRHRSLEIRLPAAAPPRAVRVGTRQLAWQHRLGDEGWTYDGPTATVIVRVARIDLARTMRVTFTRDPAAPEALADGLAGLLRRLDAVSRYSNMASPAFTKHKDERAAVEVAQTGRRIGLAPATFATEVRQMRRLLRRLPRALRDVQAVWRKLKSAERVGYYRQARNILQTALGDE